MSSLMTNIRRASIPLQESSQHLGRLLMSLGQAADSTLDADTLAELNRNAELAAAAAAPGAAPKAADATEASLNEAEMASSDPTRADSGEKNEGEDGGAVAESASGRNCDDIINAAELSSPDKSSAMTPPADAAATTDDNTVTTRHSSSSSSSTTSLASSSLMRASSPSIHSTTTSSSSRHGRGGSSASAHGLLSPAPRNPSSSTATAKATAAAAQENPPPTTPEVHPPRQPSPVGPVVWRGFGSDADSDKVVVCESRALAHLFTRIRNRDTPSQSFNFYAKRMMRILAEEGIACLESSRQFITTPTLATFSSVFVDESNVCVVSILRAGDALAEAAQACLPHAPVGKILIQRDEQSRDKHPILFYKKFPPKIATMQVLLCDPMLATGGSALMAIRTLLEAGVKEAAIVFVSVVVCPEGLGALRAEYPEVTIVTGAIDDCLDARRYILPGLGDFGDRFFGTI